ncbi:MAG TPA: twin transmembrane helix small protein [Gammaproteobacteria bacterium]|jgi:hypothetical protein
MRMLIILILVAIIASLGVALKFLSRRGSTANRTVDALTVRIALSVALFVFLLIAWAVGWIEPHGLGG